MGDGSFQARMRFQARMKSSREKLEAFTRSSENQRRQDDNKSKICMLKAWDAEGKIVQKHCFPWKRHDNKF